ncbi:MAG TPA: hypothetical protein VFM98_01635 [Ramlibacter sp.]|uniref:hypothetical protein n=1 Tax=Ramlibacter sp. TaxID=1917967 RepID=UPI002D7E2FDD|nr:hypothetical protein [Ramlibacter sp.]HET8744277.1 hypothetical protein [Ramlibacter sp.]
MVIPAAQAGHPKALEVLRARAHLLPWVLLAVVVGFSIAGAQRGLRPLRVDLAVAPAENAESPPAAVHCEVRHGFAPSLALTARVMARSLGVGPEGVNHARGATCRVHAERP